MKRNGLKALIFLFIICTLITCIDPYNPKLDKYESLIVVDGLLTDENASNTVTLSRSKKTADEEPQMVSGAVVMVKDDLGNSTTLFEKAEGVYKTDSLSFKGEVGRSYTLFIKTADGEEYESESCLMYPVTDIDSIYFARDEVAIDNETQKGISIYIDSRGESNSNYRWTYEEWWKIYAPYPKRYNFVNDSTFTECSTINRTCWVNKKSNGINIRPAEAAFSQPIFFLASDKSSRLLIQYCIFVRQLSLSKDEYEFWDRMSQINETGGDIFDKQPFQVSGNIHNIKNKNEKVLGYFQVSGARVKMRYITNSEIQKLDIPSYHYDCNITVVGPEDTGSVQPMTFGQLYEYYTNAGYIFIEPQYQKEVLWKYVFAAPVCADCTVTGQLARPDFWIDLE